VLTDDLELRLTTTAHHYYLPQLLTYLAARGRTIGHEVCVVVEGRRGKHRVHTARVGHRVHAERLELLHEVKVAMMSLVRRIRAAHMESVCGV
jgi:hypothetical protein